MTDLSDFPIHRKWPARHPDRLQLYSLPTPNGVKVSIMLEETGLPYEPHRVDADIATLPWVNNLVGFDDFVELRRVLNAFRARPAVARGLQIPAAGDPAAPAA